MRSGIVAALLAQAAEPLKALLVGVYLHGAAADELVWFATALPSFERRDKFDKVVPPLPIRNLGLLLKFSLIF
jgi:hypothetical protein